MLKSTAISAARSGNAFDSIDDRASRRGFVSLLAVVGAWSAIGGLHAAMEVTIEYRVLHADHLVGIALAVALPWYVWALFTPLIAGSVDAWPLRRPVRWGVAVFHLCLSIVTAVLFVTAEFWLERALRPTPPKGEWLSSFESWLPFQLLAYVTVVGIAHAMLYARRARVEAVERATLTEQLTRAKLDALRARLHPHFLFNALNTIAMLVRDRDAQTAVHLIAELGGMLRDLLGNDSAEEIALRHELAFVDRYLNIEQARFGGRLRVERSIGEDVLDVAVPPLILQPLAENALRHGIGSAPGPGTIRIAARAHGDCLEIVVYDSGTGHDPESTQCDATEPAECGFGVGLATTRARLQRLYGSQANLVLTKTTAGTWATLTLPRRRIEAPDSTRRRQDNALTTGDSGFVPAERIPSRDRGIWRRQ